MAAEPAPTQAPKQSKDVVLWDGACGFCRRAIEWAGRHDRTGQLSFKPYQEAGLSPELARACAEAVHVRRADGTLLRAGRACLHVLSLTGYRPLAAGLSARPWVWAVELGYRFVARHRMLFSRWMFTSR